jgi:predicted RNase H-like nuclease (RuvC/YqgF family)
MSWRERARAILAGILIVLAFQSAKELYRWFAYSDERGELRSFSRSLDTTGVRVVATQSEAERLRRTIEARDRELATGREEIARYESRAVDGEIPEAIYPAYQRRIAEYNRKVKERNEWFARWQRVVDENSRAVDHYDSIADTMRALADRMGDPYYNVPSPLELAARRGLLPPAPSRPSSRP